MKHPLRKKYIKHRARRTIEPGDGDCRSAVALIQWHSNVSLTSLFGCCGAVNCHYHLRGEESERDRMHVESMARMHGAKYVEKHFDTSTYCVERGFLLEMGCRDLRWQPVCRALSGMAVPWWR